MQAINNKITWIVIAGIVKPTKKGTKTVPSTPAAIYKISVITISGWFMARSSEIIIFNIVAITNVTKCGE